MSELRQSKFYVQILARTGVLTAIAFVLMIFEFPVVFFFPPWLELGFSDTVALIGGVVVGPFTAVMIQILKNVFSFIFGFSTTGGIGEIANAIAGIGYVLPIVLIYNRMKSKKGLVVGMIIGGMTMTIVACAANYLFIIDLFFGELDPSAKWDMIKSIFLGFNLFKAVVESIVGLIILKYMKGAIKYLRINYDEE